ncbi:MAG: hypothetical protein PVF63_03450 [Gammaproteobacteria bacterium]|jgi:hypothetical protein
MSGLAESSAGSPGDLLRDIYSKFKVTIWFAIAGAVVCVGYDARADRDLTAESGLGYVLGIVAVTCMVLLLLFPLRKRFAILKFLGATPTWFRNHQVLGIAGPIAALYHCNFNLGSLNSRVALYSALTVAASGIVGRFIYTKVFRGLNVRKASLKQLAASMHAQFPESGQNMVFLPELIARVGKFDEHVLASPRGMLDAWLRPLRLIYETRREQWRLARFARRKIMIESIYNEAIANDRRKIQRVASRCIARHLVQVRRVAEFTAYQRLFALWHRIHLPFFLLLVVSVIVHIYAVHSY